MNLRNILEQHPWDWFAHIIMGLFVFFINQFFVLLVFGFVDQFTALFSAINFILAIELAQFDIFGLNEKKGQCTWYDYLIDLACGGFGIWIGLMIF